MRFLYAPLLASMLAAAPLLAAEPPPAAKTEAAADDVPALIKRLGDDDPKARDEASEKLRRLGQIAAPALAEAQKSDDPEVASRAKAIARRIEDDRRAPALEETDALSDPRRMPRIAPLGPRLRAGAVPDLRTSLPREVEATDGGRRIKIREDAEGVSVTTIERTADGAEVTKTTKAKDASALKREFPEVYALYARHAHDRRAEKGEFRIEPFDFHGDVDADRMLRDARRMLDEHRPMIEARRREADAQLREARRQLDEQVRQFREDERRRRE